MSYVDWRDPDREEPQQSLPSKPAPISPLRLAFGIGLAALALWLSWLDALSSISP